MKIILEMANNHMGDVNHGKLIISEFRRVIDEVGLDADYFIKFQYRDLRSYINFKAKTPDTEKYINRFTSTELSNEQFQSLAEFGKENGFKLACTPFDAISAKRVIKEKFDVVKVASACIDDWDLNMSIIESLSQTSSENYDPAIIFSTGGANFDQIDRLASFYRHRFNGDISILHCVAEYPYHAARANLGKISKLIDRYPFAQIGYSAHESPEYNETGALAYCLGARVFEKHVGVANEKYKTNAYTLEPLHFKKWLQKLSDASEMMQYTDTPTTKETKTVYALKRGAVASQTLNKGDNIKQENVSYKFPRQEGQLGPEDFGIFKTQKILKTVSLSEDDQILSKDINIHSEETLLEKQIIAETVREAKGLLHAAGFVYPVDVTKVELSHHKGIANLHKFGAVIIERINTDLYSKKILVLIPGQRHPAHLHPLKDETFELMYGDLTIRLNNDENSQVSMVPGDLLRVKPGTLHEFWSLNGAVFEEIATTAIAGDSKYNEPVDIKRKSSLQKYWDLF